MAETRYTNILKSFLNEEVPKGKCRYITLDEPNAPTRCLQHVDWGNYCSNCRMKFLTVSNDNMSERNLNIADAPLLPKDPIPGKCQHQMMKGSNIGRYCSDEVVPGSNYCKRCIHKIRHPKFCKSAIGSFCNKLVGPESDYCEECMRMKD